MPPRTKTPPTGATLQTIAESAGVHYSLVSRVLRADPAARLSHEKRAQILSIANAVGYRPNRVARSLRARKSHLLAMLVPDITNPFHAAMFRGVEAVAQARGYSVILCDTDDDDGRFRNLVNLLSEGHVDGLLVASAKHDDKTIGWLHSQTLPFVLLNRRRESGGDPWVGPDDYRLGALGAQHLAGLGHRKVLLLIGDLGIDNMRRRALGFFETLKAAGVPKPAVTVRSNLVTHAQARSCVTQLAGRIAAGQITAVFALSTIASNGAVAALANAGLRWPKDVSVVGYSGADAPDVTSVKPPVVQVGEAGAAYLIDRLESAEPAPELNLTLPVELVEAASTGRVRSAPEVRSARASRLKV